MSTSPTRGPLLSSWNPEKPARGPASSAAEADVADLAEGTAGRLSHVSAPVLGQPDEKCQRFLSPDLSQGLSGALPDIDVRVGQGFFDGGDRSAVFPPAEDSEHRALSVPGRPG